MTLTSLQLPASQIAARQTRRAPREELVKRPNAIRYIGSKARLVDAIANLIEMAPGRRFADLFCGSGVVARSFGERGCPLLLNDHLTSATVLAMAEVTAAADVSFTSLGGYHAALARLQAVDPIEGFVFREYSPGRRGLHGSGRRYFTPSNAGFIDGARREVEAWDARGFITSREKVLLIADLLAGASSVANTAGTYGCFMREWSDGALRPLQLRPRKFVPTQVAVEATNVDVFQAPVDADDVVYLDPPYTKRQYAAYYHILETITIGDEPVVDGLTGLRPWRDKASDFCYKRRALPTLVRLIKSLPSRRIFLSYSTEGHVDLGDLVSALKAASRSVCVHDLGDIGRYRPNLGACARAATVGEYLVEIGRN